MSVPHMPKRGFACRAIVCELTGLWRCAYDKISCYSFPLKRSVRDLFSLRQVSHEKNKGGSCLAGLVVF